MKMLDDDLTAAFAEMDTCCNQNENWFSPKGKWAPQWLPRMREWRNATVQLTHESHRLVPGLLFEGF